MPGLVPPARPRPLRRRRPGHPRPSCGTAKNVDGRDKPGHDECDDAFAPNVLSLEQRVRLRARLPGMSRLHPRAARPAWRGCWLR
ncbi:hypothetical protein CO669_16825 [Bradyrhizobium sp. Y36]|nr:hypothetical protein CO669_16825 [Bradyrhizobium sp. Y36]